MKYTLFIFQFFFITNVSYAQNADTWVAFWNQDTTLVGYKDRAGVIKIHPKFSGLTAAAYFDDIMSASEEKAGVFESYFLTKNGHVIGRDSLHMFDNAADCECEGFIRFRDKKTDRVGMFNRQGDIVIPAIYNDLSKARNGLVVALKNARKEIMEGGEHYSYVGGEVILIDTANNALIDSFVNDDNINFYSVEIDAKPHASAIRQSFKANDGRYYSFIHFDKEFKAWLKSSLLANLTKQNQLKVSYPEMAYWNDDKGWMSEKSNNFITKNYQLIKAKLTQLNLKDAEYDIVSDGLNPFIYNSAGFKKYYNNCGESKDWMYPMRNVLINDAERHDLTQDQFEFLRTENGYKLISVNFGNGGLR